MDGFNVAEVGRPMVVLTNPGLNLMGWYNSFIFEAFNK